jgi:ABC-type transport system substrate-binding protein
VAQAVAGNVDIATGDGLDATQLPRYVELEQRGSTQVAVVHGPAWEQLIFNLYAPTTFASNSRAQPHPILSDVRVRQAIAYAVDRQALIDSVYGGKSFVLNEARVFPNHPLYASNTQITLYAFDPERAGALLEQAGWVDTDDDGIRECQGCASGAEEGSPLSLTYRTTSSPLRDQVVTQVQDNLNAVGFDIGVELLPREVFFGDATGLIVGDFDIGQFAELTGVDPGGERQYGCEWVPSPDNGWYGENYSGWCNEQADQALLEASRSLRVDERRAAYVAFQRGFTRNLPTLPLFPRVEPFIVNPKLENLKLNDSMPSVTWNAYELALPGE